MTDIDMQAPTTPEESAPSAAPAPEYAEPKPVSEPAVPLSEAVSTDDDGSLKGEPDKDDIERLLGGDGGPFALSTGTEITVKPLKLREFLALLRIVTRGANSAMSQGGISFDSTDDFVQSFFGLVLFAIPEADDETISFVQSMVQPAHLTGNPQSDAALRERLMDELENPELEDLVNILAVIVTSEGSDLSALGKRLTAMFSVAKKMGLTKGLTGTSQQDSAQ